ncbi:YfgM family protein [Aliidiomarina minuta]|uniref:YfgM family protein n=1 Tax=Aliidiomarina minuta TaxID=880057 RepID=UPI0013005D88|nr:tetratricopeptide repeat protein [Aliidiomarina minuta]
MEDEDQQVEQIKKFLREYGIWIGAGIVIGLGSLFSWRAWQASTIDDQHQRTAAYEQVSERLQRGADDETMQLADQLLNEMDDTSYAVVTRLQLAQQAVRDGELERAADILYKAHEQAGEPVVKAMALVRLARVQMSLGEHDAALTTLQQDVPQSFKGQVAEVRGDVYLAQGNHGEARSAYQTAINEGDASVSPALQMKFDNLASE